MPNTNEQRHTPLNATRSAHSTDTVSVNLFNDPTAAEGNQLQMVLASFLVYFGVDKLATFSLVCNTWNRTLHSTEVMAYLFDEIGITLPTPKTNTNNANSNATTEVTTQLKTLSIDDYLAVLKDGMYQRKYMPRELRDGLAETVNLFLRIPQLDLDGRMGKTDYIDFLNKKNMSAGIMRGTDRLGRPFISMCLEFYDSDDKKNTTVITVFKRYHEPALARDDVQWVSCSRSQNILPDYFSQDNRDHYRNKLNDPDHYRNICSFWGTYIRRLRNNEPCGKSYGDSWGAQEDVDHKNRDDGESSVTLASFKTSH